MMKKLMLIILVVLSATTLISCNHQPAIPGYHWHGSVLYDKGGVEVASVTVLPFWAGSSQACIFATSGLPDNVQGCTYWETGQQAYDHVAEAFRR